MTIKTLSKISLVLAALASLSACGNTIRGIGQDTANTVNATEAAGRDVARAAQ
ncbi:entericidin [Rhizobium sp. TRM96647]|jgi:entericidin B|uniref:Entericidin B n=1 Tax=Mycoplana azooxidifex TaxID=1636188 RepID=A0A7W6D1V1_9HYPH|nr:MULTISPECIES: entericidin [Rhizobiaceae]MBB3975171.1 entericidin B [Mycoplana azooxidifex]MCD2181946.1 entericidin [Rhizobium sp. GN54]MCV3736997.1 entericidin [Rhizobium sp. TRM96647]MCV3756603.1 entericidin [Rhizobium sp. TRM96650]